MGVGVGEVVEAFQYFFDSILSRTYAKSVRFEHYNENQLLPLVRSYLLGYFWDDMKAELASSLPGRATKSGRIDFVVGDIAVELAVRPRGARGKRALCAAENETEVKKLLRWPGPGVLILFDFGRSLMTEEDLKAYRVLPSLGKGRWTTSSFQLAYLHQTTRPRGTSVVRKRVLAR